MICKKGALYNAACFFRRWATVLRLAEDARKGPRRVRLVALASPPEYLPKAEERSVLGAAVPRASAEARTIRRSIMGLLLGLLWRRKILVALARAASSADIICFVASLVA